MVNGINLEKMGFYQRHKESLNEQFLVDKSMGNHPELTVSSSVFFCYRNLDLSVVNPLLPDKTQENEPFICPIFY